MAIKNIIQLRRGTDTDWSSSNTVLASGEPGFDLNNNILKIGDGLKNWNELNPIGGGDVNVLSEEPNGFVNTTDSVISTNFSNVDSLGSGIVTLSPSIDSFDIFIRGVKHTFSSALTTYIPDTTDLYFVYIDKNDVTLKAKTGYMDHVNDIPVSYIYWNTSNNQTVYLAEERHGIKMDSATHYYLHRVFGAQYISGLGLSFNSLTGDGSSSINSVIGIGDGIIFDEDDEINIINAPDPNNVDLNNYEQILSPIAKIPVLYKDGASGAWKYSGPVNYPLKIGSSAQYNQHTGTTWTTTDGGNGKFIGVWIVATNNILYPIIAIMGQRVDDNIGQSDTNNLWENLDLTDLPVVEIRPLYRLIFETDSRWTSNDSRSALRNIKDIRNITNITGGGLSPSDHGNLFGLLDDDHSQYVHISTSRTISAVHNFSNGLKISGVPVPTGTGTSGYVTKFVNSSGLGTGVIYDNGSSIGIGTNNPETQLHVVGSGKFNDITSTNTYCNKLYLTPSGEYIGASYTSLYQYSDQPTTLLEINQSNLQIIGVSGSALSNREPTTYPAISFNKLSNIDFNRTPIKLTSCLTTGGSGGPSWPSVTGISSQAMSSGIFFEDRLWKPSAYDPNVGFAYDATSQIVSTPSSTIAGYTKLSFLVQTASGVVNPNNGSVPPGSYVERFSIGSDGITTVNGIIRADSGEINNLIVSEGGLNVNGGIIQVNNSFDNNFLMVINSSGISISANYEFIADYIDGPVTPGQLLSVANIDPTTIKILFNNQILEVNDTILFRGFTNNVLNGIYQVIAGTEAGKIRFIRHPDYPAGNTLYNGDLFGVRYNGSSYILNSNLTLGESKIIGTDILTFFSYSGQKAVTFNTNSDAEFASAVYAKEKYFRIKHPDPDSSYQYLQYGSLESPYHGVRLTGESELKKGAAKIPLPKYLKHLIHKKDINIQLTNNGHHKMLYVDSVNLDKDHFIVKGYRSKTGGPFRFYWSFTGIRKDVDTLVPEQ